MGAVCFLSCPPGVSRNWERKAILRKKGVNPKDTATAIRKMIQLVSKGVLSISINGDKANITYENKGTRKGNKKAPVGRTGARRRGLILIRLKAIQLSLACFGYYVMQ